MRKNAVSKVLHAACEAIPSLLEHTDALTAFLDLIETVDKLPDMERRFHAEGMSLYQGISKGLTQSELENGLGVFFGSAVKPAGEEASASVHTSAAMELLGGIQADQTLFVKHVGDAEFYGTLWPWPKKENVITVHLGISTRGLSGAAHQAMYDAVREYMTQKVSASTDTGLGGRLQGVSLPSFLQMSEMEGSTCTLRIRSGQKVGAMHLLDGKLIDAETKTLRHREAAYAILCWDDTEIDILKPSGRKKNEIGLPLMHILMEAIKKKDEGDHEKTETPPETPLKKAPAKKSSPPKVSAKKKPEAKPAAPQKKPAAKKKTIKKQPDPAAPAVPPPPEKKDEPQPPDPEPVLGAETESGLEMPLKKPPKSRRHAPAKKKNRVLIIAGVAVLLLCLGLFLFLRGGAKSAEAAYADLLTQLRQVQAIDAKEKLVRNFLKNYPKDKAYTGRAEKKLAELKVQKEDAAYEKASQAVFKLPLNREYRQKAGTIFDAFLQKNPDSRHRKEIEKTLAKISDLTDDAYFSEFSSLEHRDYTARLVAYNAYLTDYPEGRHRAKVQELITDALNSSYKEFLRAITKCERKGDWDGCLNVCSDYKAAYSGYLRMDAVDQVEKRMRHEKAFAHLKTQTKEADDETIRRLYLAFLADYPDSPQKDNLSERVAAIEKESAVRDEWARVQTLSRDEKVPLNQRIAEIKRYIERNPSGRHMIEAENILWKLEQPVQASGQVETHAVTSNDPSGTPSQTSADRDRQEEAEQEKARQAQRIEVLRKKVFADLQKTGGRFAGQSDGTVVDTVTGLVWTALDSSQVTGACMDHNRARQYVNQLVDGGHNDWRLPTAAELAGIYKNSPYFPAGDAAWYWSSETYSKGYQNIANIVTTRQETEYRKKAVSVEKCGAVRAVRP